MNINYSSITSKAESQAIIAIYNHVWKLTEAQRAECSIYQLRKIKLAKFLAMLDTEHDYLDYIQFEGTRFRVNYTNTSSAHLETLTTPDVELILSFRANRQFKVYCCLAMLATNTTDYSTDNIKELVV